MIPRYRAWLKKDKEMIDVDEIHFNNGELDYIGDAITWMCKKNDFVLMQSTGEDIVKVTDVDERTNFPDGGIGTICGLDEIFMWYIDGQVHNGLFDISQEYYIEVIGNIYENQELLEVSS